MNTSIKNKIKHNLFYAKVDFQELSGSLGDLGTFLPLILGLAYITGLSFPAMLFWAGAANIITGLTFTIPMPVQPMKAIATVALSEGMTVGEVYASGLLMALIMLIIWRLNISKQMDKLVPKALVRGIQFTIGFKLLLKGVGMIYDKPVAGYDSIAVSV